MFIYVENSNSIDWFAFMFWTSIVSFASHCPWIAYNTVLCFLINLRYTKSGSTHCGRKSSISPIFMKVGRNTLNACAIGI